MQGELSRDRPGVIVLFYKFGTDKRHLGKLGDVEPIGTEDLCERMTPNTATHTTIASAHTIAARRMAKSPTLRALNAMGRREPRFGPPTLFISSYPTIADRFHQTFHY